MTQPTRFNVRSANMAMRLLALGGIAVLAACGRDDQAANPAAVPITVPGSASQVQAEVGDASVNVVAIQTSQLPAEVAAQHGYEQRDDLVMLRISPREGEAGSGTSAPVEVRATVTDLRGTTDEIQLEQEMVAGLVDHVGRIEVTLPTTLRFEITVVSEQGETETLRLSRDFDVR